MRILMIGDRHSAPVNVTARLLTAAGHEVRVHVPGDGPSGNVRRLRGSFGLDSSHARVRALVERMQPDCVHVMGLSSRVAPAVALAARQCGVRTLWSLSDYAPICPAGICRTPEGNVCEECLHGTPRVMVRRCVGGRTVDSFMALLDTLYWDVKRLSRAADRFIVPSEFMRSKWLEMGFPAMRVFSLATPVRFDEEISSAPAGGYFCYCGPLTAESGVETLARAALAAGVSLVIAGSGEILPRLHELAERSKGRIRIGTGEDAGILGNAVAAVVPSESYTAGVSLVKKALCGGIPVIASAIAGLPEMVGEDDGVTFAPGNVEQLEVVLRDFDRRHAFDRDAIAARARRRFCEETYCKKLIELYCDC